MDKRNNKDEDKDTKLYIAKDENDYKHFLHFGFDHLESGIFLLEAGNPRF